MDQTSLLRRIEDRLISLEHHVLDRAAAPSGECTAEAILAFRRARDRIFPSGYFGDAAWDLLLELSIARRDRQRLAISDLGVASGVAPTTALRYIDRFVADGLVDRVPDPHDRRRVHVQLTAQGAEAMSRVMSDLAKPAGRPDDRSRQATNDDDAPVGPNRLFLS